VLSMSRPGILLALCCGQFAFAGDDRGTAINRNFWSADKIEWGDGRPGDDKPVKKGGPYPQGYKADFKLDIPATGWYELVFQGGAPKHDLLVDGKYAYHRRDLSKLGAEAKAGNVWLEGGKRELRIQRVGYMGFPTQLFESFALRPADNRPEACVTAAKTIVDVVRAGEKLEITATGGGLDKDVTYELLSRSLVDKTKPPEVVGEVSFGSSSSPETKTVEIDCPAEGAFALGAKIKGGKELLQSEFPIGPYGVVDVKNIAPASGKLQTIHAIDCVAQTDNGHPVPAGSYFEGGGPTRITTSAAGTYRESAPSAVFPVQDHDQSLAPGFSYRLDLPEADVPYLLDVEFPDDARRSVAIYGHGGYGGTGGKGYETGGMHPFTNAMQHHRIIFWPQKKDIVIALFSTQYLCRAAAAKITVSRFEDGLVPATKVQRQGGRVFAFWWEEGDTWSKMLGVKSLELTESFAALDRLARLCRYSGCNGISLPAVSYQAAFYRTDALDGFSVPDFDLVRLEALFCEKYGMAYLPEVFPAQWYLNLVELPKRVENPSDIRSVDCNGAESGNSACPCNLNPLHPVVQKLWADALGDLADKLRDSPAFQGVTARADGWLFRGDFHFPGINWGYGDWTIRQFEQDSGVKVPGAPGDPQRFIQRFDFLTSKAMKDQWVAWRCGRILDYHRQLRDRIRRDRRDLFFGIAGDFTCDPAYQEPDNLASRALECGVAAAKLKTEDGLALIPCGRYGSRNLGLIAQKAYDDFVDPVHVGAGMGVVRAFANYFTYQEFGRNNPWRSLGMTEDDKAYYCAACPASGRNCLEKYAVVLARQDTAFTRDGGDNDPFGDPAALAPWFAEFEALPALPFDPVAQAQDPVAVWSKNLAEAYKDFQPGFYFYAVNREQYPVRTTLVLKDAGKLLSLGAGEKVEAKDGVLALDLQPYELRAFRADEGAEIVTATTAVPAAAVEAAKRRLAFAQTCKDESAGMLGAKELAAFDSQLAAAWDALGAGHCWRARTALSMTPALAVYTALATLPEGQERSEFPGLLLERPIPAHWMPREPVTPAEQLKSPLNGGLAGAAWGGAKVLAAKDGRLEIELAIPADGPYLLRVGAVSPKPGVTVAALDGVSLPRPMTTRTPNAPETYAFPPLDLKAGTAKLSLRRDGDFGVYGIQLLPKLKPTTNKQWRTLGPFVSRWVEGGNQEDTVRAALATKFIPEDKVALDGVYKNAAGKELRWQSQPGSSVSALDDLVIGMACRTGSPCKDINYAVTFIESDADRSALLCLGADWWAIAWLNGERLSTDLERKTESDPDFSTWRELRLATLKLKKGTNTLLVKQHGGIFGSGLGAYITDVPGISCAASPNK